jgi:hypothetical protein
MVGIVVGVGVVGGVGGRLKDRHEQAKGNIDVK